MPPDEKDTVDKLYFGWVLEVFPELEDPRHMIGVPFEPEDKQHG